MDRQTNAPATHSGQTRARVKVCYKDSAFVLSKLQSELFVLLADGDKHSSHQLMLHLKTSDPRREVKRLRDRGIDVQDVWVDATSTIPRHKCYFINLE
ncbi:MAG: hypothetical protein SNJ29_08940 [Rikenellaceae bacterium]